MPHKDPDAKRAYFKAYHLRNRTKILARCAVWLEANRERNKESSKAYYTDHKDEANAKSRANYAAKKAAKRLQQNSYAAEHRDEAIARTKAWRKANPDKRQNMQVRRRAMKKNAPVNDLTHAQWATIQEAQDHRCAYCDKRFLWRLSQDHITPLVQGGSHTLHNVIGACSACNAKKNVHPPLKPVQPLLL